MFQPALIPLGGVTVWIIGAAFKGVLVLLLALLAAAALRRASAGIRHLIWSVGMLAVLLLPLMSLALPWQLPVVSVPVTAATTTPIGSETPAPSADASETETRNVARGVTDRSSEQSGLLAVSGRLSWLFVIWGVGVLFLLGRLGIGAMVLKRVVHGAKPLDSSDWKRPLIEGADRLSISRLPRLLTDDRVPMPVVCGLLNPAIIVPADARDWSDRRRRAVLCHELAHIRRFDLPANLLGRLACALHWFNPLVWFAARRLRVESERACDDFVLGVGTRPSEYADHLLQIVGRARHSQAPAVAIPMAQRKEFEGRMLAILDREIRREPPSRRHAAGFAALALVLVVPIAAIGPTPARPPATSAPLSRNAESAEGRYEISHPMLVTLLEELRAAEASRRVDAANTLGTLKAESAVPSLGELLSRDPNQTVRLTAAWALGQIASPDAVHPLSVTARRDAAEEVRVMSVWALGQAGDPASIPTLVAALGDNSHEVRIRAAWAIGTIRPPSAPARLVEALRDTDDAVCETAAWALGEIRDSSAVPALATVARNLSSKASFESLWSLARIGGAAARQPLRAALNDGVVDVKLHDAIERAIAGDSIQPRPRPWPIPAIR